MRKLKMPKTAQEDEEPKVVILEASWDQYSPAVLSGGKISPDQDGNGNDQEFTDIETCVFASHMTIDEFRAIKDSVISFFWSDDITKFTVEEHDNYWLIKPDWSK